MAATETQVSRKSLEFLDDGSPRFHGCSKITEYEYLGKLGEGTFGEVSKARSKKTGQVVALKKILMHNEKDGFPITALREIKLLKQLDHVNVLKLEEMAVERPKNASKKPSMFMVTPYMDHDLSGLLENPNVHFTEPQIKCYMKQLLEGCAYLHENKILHRDMKAANLLINNRGILQIADFGLARPYDDDPPKPGQGGGEATREYTTLVVTRWYRPPELLLQLRRYTTAIDMWGVGCVFGEMFKRKPILAGNSDLNQAQLIFDLVGSPTDETMPGWRDLPGCEGVTEWAPRSSSISRVFADQSAVTISLLTEFLKLDWRKRINAIDALQHPYFHTHPLPARPEDLPVFEESHELDRRKFRDQKQKPPPAPAGGSVGIGTQGEWGINGRPIPYDHRSGSRVPGGRPFANGHGMGHGRRPPPSTGQNGGYADYRNAQRDMPPYDSAAGGGHRPAYDHSRVPPASQPHDDAYSRRPRPHDHNLPPRPPVPDGGPYRHGYQDGPAYRDDVRGPPRSRIPPGTNDTRRPAPDRQQAVDTYIPSYSHADPNARPPPNVLSGARKPRRDDRPPHADGRREGPSMDYGEPVRYDESRGEETSGGPTSAGYDRRRSRSPRDWSHGRDRGRDRERDHDRTGYGNQDLYRR